MVKEASLVLLQKCSFCYTFSQEIKGQHYICYPEAIHETQNYKQKITDNKTENNNN